MGGKNSRKFRGEIVKKDNILNEGISTLDTAEKYKLMLLMIAQISTQDKLPTTPEDIANRIYSFYIDDYAEMKKIKNKYWFEDYVAEITDYLKRNSAITLIERDEGGELKSYKTVWIFDFVDFQKDKKGWKVLYKFTYSVSIYLFELKNKFIAYHLKNIMPMRSKYSIRLYELLKQYEKIGERLFDIDEFREKIGTRVFIVDNKTGKKKVLQDDYKDFRDLKKWVIEKAVEEVNKYSDIEITDVEYHRKGRRIGFITFHFRPRVNFDFPRMEEIKEKVEADKKEVLEKSKELPLVMEITWKNIGELRKYFKNQIEEILEYMDILKTKPGAKVNQLSENEILFLLINADRDFFNDELIVSIIKQGISNRNLEKPMGFLIDKLGINSRTAKFIELTLTSQKIDQELFIKELEEEENVVSVKSAKEMMKKMLVALKDNINKSALKLLKEPCLSAVIDEIDDVVYIPVPDEIYKEWIEKNYLQSIKEFLRENFDVSDVEVEVISKENDWQ